MEPAPGVVSAGGGPGREARLVTPALVLVTVTLFLGAQVPNVFVLAPRFLADRGHTEDQLGVIMGGFNLASLVMSPVVGWLCLRLGHARVLAAGCLVSAVGAVGFALADELVGFTAGRALQGLGFAAVLVGAAAYVAETAPPARLGEALGLAGVLTMLRPSGHAMGALGMAGALLSAVAYALSAISVRVLTRTDTTVSMVFWFLVLLTLFSGLIAWRDWVPVRSADWGWILGLGLLGIIGQHFVTEAFRHAPASVIAPFEYTALLWGVAIDWAVWSVLPGLRALAGGGLVVAAGLYLIWREQRLHRELAASIESPASMH